MHRSLRTPALAISLLALLPLRAQDNCTACFTMAELAPFQAQFVSCSSGGSGPLQMGWAFDATDTLHGTTATWQFTAGTHVVCHAAVDTTDTW